MSATGLPADRLTVSSRWYAMPIESIATPVEAVAREGVRPRPKVADSYLPYFEILIAARADGEGSPLTLDHAEDLAVWLLQQVARGRRVMREAST